MPEVPSEIPAIVQPAESVPQVERHVWTILTAFGPQRVMLSDEESIQFAGRVARGEIIITFTRDDGRPKLHCMPSSVQAIIRGEPSNLAIPSRIARA